MIALWRAFWAFRNTRTDFLRPCTTKTKFSTGKIKKICNRVKIQPLNLRKHAIPRNLPLIFLTFYQPESFFILFYMPGPTKGYYRFLIFYFVTEKRLFPHWYSFFAPKSDFHPLPFIFWTEFGKSVVTFCGEFIYEQNKKNRMKIGAKMKALQVTGILKFVEKERSKERKFLLAGLRE